VVRIGLNKNENTYITNSAKGINANGYGSLFKIVSALNKNENMISFQSINNPNSYLRHFLYRIHLHGYKDYDLFKNDASFSLAKSLNADSNRFSFESANFPNYLIAINSNSELFIINKNQTDNENSNWIIEEKNLSNQLLG
jgi:hypothetical protein